MSRSRSTKADTTEEYPDSAATALDRLGAKS
jgi:hypothetical protein